jgi:hypothetical protein
MHKVNKPKQLPSGRWYARVYSGEGTRRTRTFRTRDEAVAAVSSTRPGTSRGIADA